MTGTWARWRRPGIRETDLCLQEGKSVGWPTSLMYGGSNHTARSHHRPCVPDVSGDLPVALHSFTCWPSLWSYYLIYFVFLSLWKKPYCLRIAIWGLASQDGLWYQRRQIWTQLTKRNVSVLWDTQSPWAALENKPPQQRNPQIHASAEPCENENWCIYINPYPRNTKWW